MTLQDRLKSKTRGLALPAFPAKKLTKEAEDKLIVAYQSKLISQDLLALLPERIDVDFRLTTDDIVTLSSSDIANKKNQSYNQAISEIEKSIKEYCGVEG